MEPGKQIEKEQQRSVEVINARFLKPLDKNTIIKSIEKTKKVITLEDGNSINSGTSLAAPYITGIVALILQNSEEFIINPNKDMHSQIYEHLKSLSKDLGVEGKDAIYGEGLVIIK